MLTQDKHHLLHISYIFFTTQTAFSYRQLNALLHISCNYLTLLYNKLLDYFKKKMAALPAKMFTIILNPVWYVLILAPAHQLASFRESDNHRRNFFFNL